LTDETYFWGAHSGAEIDLLLLKNGRRRGFECKRLDAPRLAPSMRNAFEDLQLDSLTVLYPGDRRYPLADRIDVAPLSDLSRESRIDL
jgi:predicted AAA+ superfamily ATPase